MKEYAVGETFSLLGHNLKTVLAENKCVGCFFYRKVGIGMNCMYRYLECVAEDRKDNNDVVFKKV